MNKFGDVVCIERSSLEFSIRKRHAIRQFSAKLEAKLLERGFSLNICFTSYQGNRNDFIDSLKQA